MSYPVAGMVKDYKHPGYPGDHEIIPHGSTFAPLALQHGSATHALARAVSVIVHAPAVFRFTSGANPARHKECAKVRVA